MMSKKETPSKGKSTMISILLATTAVVAAYVVVGTLLDSVLLPERDPEPRFIPPVGYTFHSKSEGFTQTVVKRENGLLWTDLELDPYASGPPEHVHTSFPEHFVVAEGTLSVLANGEKHTLHAGESFLVPPGMRHKPFNETGERVLVQAPREPGYALPERFGVFLTQAYGYFDEAPNNNRAPAALFQMSRFSSRYDSWLADIPIPVQKTLWVLVRPAAWLLGFRSHYERFAPRHEEARR